MSFLLTNCAFPNPIWRSECVTKGLIPSVWEFMPHSCPALTLLSFNVGLLISLLSCCVWGREESMVLTQQFHHQKLSKCFKCCLNKEMLQGWDQWAHVCAWERGVGGGGKEAGGVKGIKGNVSGITKLKIKHWSSFRWACCNPGVIEPSRPRSIHHTCCFPFHPPSLPCYLPERVLLHLQLCEEGRSPTKADCDLIKFIICRELILQGNLSPLVLKESWITHLL